MTVQAIDSDTETLHKLGYAQELLRRMGGFSNFAVSFTIISILSGLSDRLRRRMLNGGPIDMNIGWPLVGIMVIIVGLAMAEVCSSYPTAGGLYYWSAKLGGKNAAGVELVHRLVQPARPGRGHRRHRLRPRALRVSVAQQLVRTTPRRPAHPAGLRGRAVHPRAAQHVRRPPGRAAQRHLGLVAHRRRRDHRRRPADRPEAPPVGRLHLHPLQQLDRCSFPGNVVYVFLIGLLLAQYTFTGYDASAHMTEETHNAAIAGPRGIVCRSSCRCSPAGSCSSASRPRSRTTGPRSTAVVPAGADLHRRRGRRAGQFLLLIAIGAQFYCGMSSVTANSRMIYAFSRDGAVPGSSVLEQDQQAHAHPNQLDLARGGRGVHPVAARTSTTRPRIPRSSPSRSSACTSPTASRSSCGFAPATAFQPGPWQPRAVEPADRHRSRSSGSCSSASSSSSRRSSRRHSDNFNYTIVAFAVVLGGTTSGGMVVSEELVQGTEGSGNRWKSSPRSRRSSSAGPVPAVAAG